MEDAQGRQEVTEAREARAEVLRMVRARGKMAVFVVPEGLEILGADIATARAEVARMLTLPLTEKSTE